MVNKRKGSRLEVEDEDERQGRIQSSLERLDSTRTKGVLPTFDFSARQEPIEPPTELLSRVQAFLPQLKASNEVLLQKAQVDPQSLDIENIDENDTHVIEMNLGLGVFEDRSHKTRERESESESESEDDTEDMSSLSDTSSSSSQSGILASNSTSRPKMPLPKRARPEIVVLDDHTTPR